MALTGNFSLLDVKSEFGLNTKPSSDSLSAYYNHIFGSAGSGSSLTDFNGHGAPIVSSFSAIESSEKGGKIDVSFSINIGSLTSQVIFEYRENDGSFSSTTDWINWGTIGYTAGGSKSQTITVPNINQSYYVRVTYYNLFNNGSSLDYLSSRSIIAQSSGSGGGGDPQNLTNLQYLGGGFGVTYPHTWEYVNTGETSFMVEVNYDTSSSWESAGVNNISSSGNNYSGDLFSQELMAPAGATTMQFRMRKNTSEAWAYGSGISID